MNTLPEVPRITINKSYVLLSQLFPDAPKGSSVMTVYLYRGEPNGNFNIELLDKYQLVFLIENGACDGDDYKRIYSFARFISGVFSEHPVRTVKGKRVRKYLMKSPRIINEIARTWFSIGFGE
ncbi:hypothetical protein [Aliivibrio wodanis]|uniref:hypothetical protein n=1 Tax=Aliivibrio wodanis TaxID=80852 RepID=UPI00406C2AAB